MVKIKENRWIMKMKRREDVEIDKQRRAQMEFYEKALREELT